MSEPETTGELLPASTFDPAHPMATLLDPTLYAQLGKVAKNFSTSQLIPKHFQGKPEDIFIGLHMAYRLGADPVMVLQNLYIVSGTPGWSAKFIIAQANRARAFRGSIKFRYEGEGASFVAYAYATLAETGEEVEAEASMAMAKAEGWTKNTKYASMPKQMLSYRAATFLVRLYCPEVLLGVPVVDEIIDVEAAESGSKVVDLHSRGIQGLKDALQHRGETVDTETGEVIPEVAPAAPPSFDALHRALRECDDEESYLMAVGWIEGYERGSNERQALLNAKADAERRLNIEMPGEGKV